MIKSYICCGFVGEWGEEEKEFIYMQMWRLQVSLELLSVSLSTLDFL